MARITVEDCLEEIPNRFALVLAATARTKQILKGDTPLINNESDNKEAVTALREIADGQISVDYSRQSDPRWLPAIHNRQDELDDELPAEKE